MTSVLGTVAASILLWLPGAWISFGWFRQLPKACVWSLSLAFSPAIVAFQMILLTYGGLAFSTAAWVAAAVNLPAAWFVCRSRLPPEAKPEAPLWSKVVGVIALVTPIAAPLLLVPGLRTFGWHHMMQLAAIAQIGKLPAIPEEMDLAGVRLNYGWLGHVSLAAVAELVGRPPTVFYPVVNASLCVASFSMMSETARRLRPDRPTLATLGVAAACLSTGLISMLASWVPQFGTLITEYRPIPLVAKLTFIDAMNVGFALLAGYVYVVVQRLQGSLSRLWLHTGLFVLGVGVSYPLLFPAAVLVALTLLGVLALAARFETGKGIGSELWATSASLAVATALCLGYTRFLQAGRHTQVVTFDLHAFLHGAKAAVLIFGPWAPLVISRALKALRTRDYTRIALVAGGLANLAAFLLLSMPSAVQYKFLFGTGLCWAPLVAEWFADTFHRLGVPSAVTVVALLSALSAAFVTRLHRPASNLEGITLDEDAEPPRAADPRFAWLNAIRDGTPSDTLIVHRPSFVPTSVLSNRSAYVQSSSGDIDASTWRLGYSMPVATTLLLVKGYPRGEFDARQAIVEQVFADAPANGPHITRSLLALHRPVAIWFERPSGYSRWLEQQQLGTAQFGDPATMSGNGSGVVWFLDSRRIPGLDYVSAASPQ